MDVLADDLQELRPFWPDPYTHANEDSYAYPYRHAYGYANSHPDRYRHGYHRLEYVCKWQVFIQLQDSARFFHCQPVG